MDSDLAGCPWHGCVGEGSRDASGEAGLHEQAAARRQESVVVGDRPGSQAAFRSVERRRAVKLLRRRPTSDLAQHEGSACYASEAASDRCLEKNFTPPKVHQNISEGMEEVQLVESVECRNYRISKDLRFSEARFAGLGCKRSRVRISPPRLKFLTANNLRIRFLANDRLLFVASPCEFAGFLAFLGHGRACYFNKTTVKTKLSYHPNESQGID